MLNLFDGNSSRLRRTVRCAIRFALGPILWLPSLAGAATISYVQGNSATPQTPQSTVTVKFNSAQAAGDLNVVVVGWNDTTATVNTVTDSSGNTYTRAVGPTTLSGALSQSIYYTKNIPAAAAGANTVTIKFSAAAVYPDIRILEYSGADQANPVDVTAAASGNSSSSSSGSATTTNATDLIFGANIVTSITSGPGTSFTKRLLTSPDGDIAEDRMVTAAGSYSATAAIGTGQWIMQMVAFRTPTGSQPTVTSISPASGPATGGTAVTIAGTNFAAGATVTFGGVAATNVVVVNSTTITANTPPGAGVATVSVTNVGGLSGSLAGGFTYISPPSVTSISPNSGPLAGGTAVTITGANFASGATVAFGTTAATSVIVVSSTSITASTPSQGSAGAVVVTVTNPSGLSGGLSNGFTYLAPPTITGVLPNTGPTAGGTAVTITGANFAAGAAVTFGSAAATNVTVVSSTTITATTPAGSTGAVTVKITVAGQTATLSNGFTYVVAPTVTSVSPNTGTAAGGTAVTIKGTNFAAGATVSFGSSAASSVIVVNNTTITATTPAGNPGPVAVAVTLDNQTGSLVNGFTYIGTPTVSSINPNSGAVGGGTAVTITGSNFAAGATVAFGTGAATSVTVVNSTTITAISPAGSSGAVAVSVTNLGSLTGSLPNGFTYVTGPTAPSGLTTVASPAPVVVASQSYINSTSLTTHTTAVFNSTGGDGIIILASSHAGVTFTPSDSLGNTWIPIAGPTSTTVGYDMRTEAWYARNPIVGSGHTVTMGLSIAEPLVISVVVVKGSNVSSPIEAISVIGSDNGTQAANVVSPGITTAGINDLLVGFAKVDPTGSVFTSGPGFNQLASASSNYLDAETGIAANPGSYSATFTLGTPQTWQSAIAAVANNPSQVTLSWNASTETGGTISRYLVERCQGVGCTTFAQIGTTTTTTYNDTGLTPAATYNYRVRAQDTTTTTGPYSTTISVTIPSAIPSLPGNLTAIPTSGSQISLSWMPSAEIGGTISQYVVGRCQGAGCANFIQIGTSSSTTFSDSGLTPSTTYTYRVQAKDTNGNVGPYAVTIANTLLSGLNITYVQGGFATPQAASASVGITFPSAQTAGDLNVVVVGWNDSTSAVSAVTDSTGNTYTLAVGPTTISGALSQSIYYAKNIGSAPVGGNTVTVKFSTAAAYPDIRILEYSGADPTNPVDVTAASTGSSGTSSSGAANTTNANDLLFGANIVQTTTSGPGAGFTQRLLTSPDGDIAEDEMVTSAGSYSATAVLSPGKWIMQMVAFRTPSGGGGTTQPPTAPSNLSASANRQGPINLTWTASASSIGIADYVVQRCQGSGCTAYAIIGTSAGTTYTDSAVTSSTTYSYQVQAVDTAGTGSAFSNVATATTIGSQPPTAPTNLTATAAGASQIELNWGASTSSLGLANYVLQRCQGVGCTTFVQVATPVSTTYTDSNLTYGASYSYQVEAIDVEGNVSPFSNIATATAGSVNTTITYVQGTFATPQAAQTSVAVKYNAAQAAGDLNVIVVGWNDSTATVSTVSDSTGNTYTRAVGPTVVSGALSQSIYYAKNIGAAAAGANTVTVTFSAAAAYPDIRILEYNGADPANPVDVTIAATGSSGSSSSGTATTTNATDLLFAANIVQSLTSGPGAGFTQRLLTSPDGDIAEDQMVTAIGSYSATAPLSSAPWIMQMVAFRTPPAGPMPAVSLSTSTIDFGSVQTGSSSSPQPVTLTNVGSALLAINSITISAGNTADFTQTNTCSTSLAVNTSCTINVSFAPTTTGSRSANLTIADNAPGTPHIVTLSGTGTGLAVTPRTSVLSLTQTQQFTASSGSVTWSVDGVVGGSALTGTINTSGLYTPPATVGSHVVTGTNDLSQSASATVYITNYPGTYTYHNDNLRTGQNLSETVLSINNVNQNEFGKLFSYSLDGYAFAQPLYVANVTIPGKGIHNVVYVATANDSVYAFDADGLTSTPLWHVSFLGTGITTIPCADTGECGDISIQIGIIGTPVIDPTTGTLYVVADTKEGSGTYVQRLHALDITTGSEKFGGPVVLQASVPGTGAGSSGGQLDFIALRENQRPALLLNNGVVYIAFGSHGDVSPWHGWVLGYNATTLQRTMAYTSTPNGSGGGIWQGGGGLATDASGAIYFVTSNGTFDVNTGGSDYGDTVQKISPTGSVVDYFTPHDQAVMDSNNLDLGAGGPVMLVDQTTGPYPHLLITAGKTGTIYVLNRDNLGGFNANNDNQIVQSLPGILPNGTVQSGNFSTPVFYDGYVYFGAVNDSIKAFQLTNADLSSGPTSQTPEAYLVRGASFAISANGNANGILWALQNNGASADNDVGNPGVLFAYDANNLAHELYNSSQAGTRDTLDQAVKFAIPLIANGKVFVAGQTQLSVFGLLP